MWDTVSDTVEALRSPLSHDLPCQGCGHATHTYLPCSDACDCVPPWLRLETRRAAA